jgi:hypothetical protein
VYWADDCYATPVPAAATFVDELDPAFWAEGFTMFQGWNSPWVSLVDEDRFGASCRRIEDLDVRTIAGCHSPTITGDDVGRAFEMLRSLPSATIPPQPDQLVLDHIIESLPA